MTSDYLIHCQLRRESRKDDQTVGHSLSIFTIAWNFSVIFLKKRKAQNIILNTYFQRLKKLINIKSSSRTNSREKRQTRFAAISEGKNDSGLNKIAALTELHAKKKKKITSI